MAAMDKELLLRFITGDATDVDKIAVTDWLDSDPEHMREYLALRKLQDISIWNYPDEAASIQKPNAKRIIPLWKRVALEALKIAAVLLVAFFGIRYFTPKSPPVEPVVMQTLHVPAGQRAELTLTDGTRVWLNAKSTFIFPNHFSDQNRLVTLEGEGYFNVTQNKAKPFVVKTEKYDIRVWGTEFNLLAYPGKGNFETSLLEGSVEVLNKESSGGIFIHPNERIFEENNRLVIAPIANMNDFLWKDGIISFDNESFKEMVTKLELYFDVTVVIKNDRFQKYRCTGKFRTKDGVDHILKVLQLSNNFNYLIDDKLNKIVIE
jgi:transmembrane sensor